MNVRIFVLRDFLIVNFKGIVIVGNFFKNIIIIKGIINYFDKCNIYKMGKFIFVSFFIVLV